MPEIRAKRGWDVAGQRGSDSKVHKTDNGNRYSMVKDGMSRRDTKRFCLRSHASPQFGAED